MTSRPSSETTSPEAGFTNVVNPHSRNASSSSEVGKSGSRTVADFDTCLRRFSGSKWSRCRCDTYR